MHRARTLANLLAVGVVTTRQKANRHYGQAAKKAWPYRSERTTTGQSQLQDTANKKLEKIVTMVTDRIKVFQVDDWAYVAAKSAEEAASFIESEPGRPADPDERELDQITPTGNLLAALQKHMQSGEGVPALIAIDNHYA